MRRLPLAATALVAFLALACGEPATGPSSGLMPTRPRLSGEALAQLSLVRCSAPSAPTTTVGEIDIWGGELNTGDAQLEVPFAAVWYDTPVQVVVPTSEYIEVELHAVGHDHFEFERPVTVTLDFSRCAADALPLDRMRVVYIDATSRQILEDMGGTVDPVARTITFETGHFSSYAVAE